VQAGYARDICVQHFLGFSLYHPALFGISTLSAGTSWDLPPGTFRDVHFTTCWTEKGRFPTHQPLSKTKLSVQA